MKKYFFFLITSFFIALIITLQWKAGVPKQSLYPLDQLESQKQLLQSFVDEQQTLEKENAELRNELEKTQANVSPSSEQKQKLSLIEITGGGVEVLLGDSPSKEDLVHAADLRDTLNLLFSSGASAISVNGRRLSPLYSVNVVGNSFLINDFYTFPPFTISAIGPPEVLISRLQDKTFLSDIHRRSREKKLRFFYQLRRNITIPPYQGLLRSEYLSEAL